ncbi:MAG: SGNH/GDSL hydrolase family protein, partial [Omnitrophica bacterium]|nr:SGNH/GDSL hydrolase family protein [Candidatus Omnitrophota bacterium]
MAWIIAGFILWAVAEVTAYTIYRSGSFEDLRKMYNTLRKRNQTAGDAQTFTPRYAEHPFLAYGLNPDFRNPSGEKIHNKYGFRSKSDFTDVEGKTVVYCAGGSSTYCNFIDRNEDTWPEALGRELRTVLNDENLKTINAGCGGWTAYQSLIRFLAWVDILKPKLVVIYHGKNDVTPFANAKLSTREIFPDYGNIIHSLRFDGIIKRFPLFSRLGNIGKVFYGMHLNRKYLNIMRYVYAAEEKLTEKKAREGLKRIGAKEWEFIMSRYRSFAAVCKDRKTSILFVIQKVRSDLYAPYMEELNRRIKCLENKEEGCFVYDFDKDTENIANMLYDHIHFTPFGAATCGRSIKN